MKHYGEEDKIMIQNTEKKAMHTIEKAIRFEKPEYIPMDFVINPSCWGVYDHNDLWDLMESHPFLFPGFVRPKEPFQPILSNVMRKDQPYVDDWGCLWETPLDGLTGTVTRHPLDDWSKYAAYRIPDPSKCYGIGKVDWEEEREKVEKQRAGGEFIARGLRHGHTFLQITDIRGYTNALYDMFDEEPLLNDLLDKITEFNSYIIQKYLDMDVDMIIIPEDLGMQNGPMLSPDNFNDYIMPCYKKMANLVKQKGTLLHMHSDGDIRTLVPSLLECGMDVLNLQDLVNGIDWIKENLKGKLCIELDIDRQNITPYGTEADIDRLILEEVKTLGNKEGGLMMIYGLYPGVPLKNAKALMDAMEKYAFYYN